MVIGASWAALEQRREVEERYRVQSTRVRLSMRHYCSVCCVRAVGHPLSFSVCVEYIACKYEYIAVRKVVQPGVISSQNINPDPHNNPSRKCRCRIAESSINSLASVCKW